MNGWIAMVPELCGVSNKQAEEILESLVKKGYIEKIQGCYRMPEN